MAPAQFVTQVADSSALPSHGLMEERLELADDRPIAEDRVAAGENFFAQRMLLVGVRAPGCLHRGWPKTTIATA